MPPSLCGLIGLLAFAAATTHSFQLSPPPSSRRGTWPARTSINVLIEDLYSADELVSRGARTTRQTTPQHLLLFQADMSEAEKSAAEREIGGYEPTAESTSSTNSITKGPDEKRRRKLSKALKRIGQLRRQDYLTLTNDQRAKVSQGRRTGMEATAYPPTRRYPTSHRTDSWRGNTAA